MAQREDLIESLRFTILQRATLLDRTNQEEVDSYNDLYKSYLALIDPVKSISKKTTKDIMGRFEKHFSKPITIKRAKPPRLEDMGKKITGLKNLSKIS